MAKKARRAQRAGQGPGEALMLTDAALEAAHGGLPYARLLVGRLLSFERAAAPGSPEAAHRVELLRELWSTLTDAERASTTRLGCA